METFRTIKQLPGHFLVGIALILLVVFAIYVLLGDRNFNLCIGLIIGFQGGAYLILFESAFRKLERRRCKNHSPE